jgi:hypothetical protein
MGQVGTPEPLLGGFRGFVALLDGWYPSPPYSPPHLARVIGPCSPMMKYLHPIMGPP